MRLSIATVLEISALGIVMLAAATVAKPALAHGEAAPGPHGGAIRMPGGFHTELKAKGDAILEIHLLDIKFQNPTTRESSVKATLHKAGRPQQETTALACEPKSPRGGDPLFVCSLPANTMLHKGDTVRVEAVRAGAPGAPADYVFPFNSTAAKGHDGR